MHDDYTLTQSIHALNDYFCDLVTGQPFPFKSLVINFGYNGQLDKYRKMI